MSENIVGENHHSWKGGGPRYYGFNWQRQRRAIRERDDDTCQICGRDGDDHIEEYDRKLPVHHITPFRTFRPFESRADYERANADSNLITLCIPCHRKADRMAPLLPDSVSITE